MAYYEACFWIVFLATVLSLCLLYASLFAIIQNTQDDVRSVLDDFITQKTMELRPADELKVTYDSLKNGSDYTSAFTSADASELEAQLIEALSAQLNSTELKKPDADGYDVFRVSNYKVDFDEEYVSSDNTLKLMIEYQIHVPVVFRGKHITTLKLDQKVVGYYNPKFDIAGS